MGDGHVRGGRKCGADGGQLERPLTTTLQYLQKHNQMLHYKPISIADFIATQHFSLLLIPIIKVFFNFILPLYHCLEKCDFFLYLFEVTQFYNSIKISQKVALSFLNRIYKVML